MKPLSVVFLLLSISMIPTLSLADYGCQRKVTALEKQLEYAKHYNNSARINGLEQALSNVRKYCGGGYPLDSSEAKSYYAAEERLEILEKIEEAKKDLAKAEYKLKKSKLKGDVEDQYEAEYKIKEAMMRIEMYEEYFNKL